MLAAVLAELDLELLPQALFARGEPRYAATAANGDHLFGRLAARSFGALLRATYTFTPRLSLQTFAQLFLAARHYDELSAFTPAGPRPQVHLQDLRYGATAEVNPDQQEATFDVNVVLRWEYRMGALLYVVYTRSQSPQLMLAPGQRGALDFHKVGRGPAADVVLVKLSYWWG